MIFDLGAVALVGVLAAIGGSVGALVQLARLVALVVAALAAAPLGQILRGAVGRITGLGDLAAGFWATSISFLAVAVVVRWIGTAAARRLTREDDARAIDRGTGALLGAGKGIVAAWLAALVWLHAEAIAGAPLGSGTSFVAAAAAWIGVLAP